MKKIFNLLPLMMTALVLLQVSCKKDEVRAVYTKGDSSSLSSSTNSVVLDSTNNSAEAVNFTWSASQNGYDADVTYTLQFDASADDSFKNATNVSVPVNALSKAFTVQDFNVLAYQNLALPANVSSSVFVRIKADVYQNGLTTGPSAIPTSFSAVINMMVTPYQIIIIYPTLWVPGDYQGWAPESAPTIASVKSNNVYEGYVYYQPGGTFQFKLTDHPDWGHNAYGWLSSSTSGLTTSGTMSATASGNLFVPATGYYLVKADLNPTPAAWSVTSTTWSIIGDATPGGWNADTEMTFDPVAGTWSVTADLVSGNFKFRANDDWALNFGYDNGTLSYNGSNIPLPATGPGNYTITMDLGHSGNYNYSIKKN